MQIYKDKNSLIVEDISPLLGVLMAVAGVLIIFPVCLSLFIDSAGGKRSEPFGALEICVAIFIVICLIGWAWFGTFFTKVIIDRSARTITRITGILFKEEDTYSFSEIERFDVFVDGGVEDGDDLWHLGMHINNGSIVKISLSFVANKKKYIEIADYLNKFIGK